MSHSKKNKAEKDHSSESKVLNTVEHTFSRNCHFVRK